MNVAGMLPEGFVSSGVNDKSPPNREDHIRDVAASAHLPSEGSSISKQRDRYVRAALPVSVRIPTKSAGDSERSRPPIPIEAGQGFR